MAYINDVTAVLSRKREGTVDSFADIWKQSCTLASLSDTELVQPRLTGGIRQCNRANIPAASPEEYCRCTVCILFMDYVLSNLQECFADHNRPQSFLHSSTSMHSMLCYRRWKCIRRSSMTVTTSSEPSLSCGSNAAMVQRNHPRLHGCIRSMQCIPVSKPIHPAAGARHFTRHHCHGRAFLFHSQTAKDIPSVVNER